MVELKPILFTLNEVFNSRWMAGFLVDWEPLEKHNDLKYMDFVFLYRGVLFVGWFGFSFSSDFQFIVLKGWKKKERWAAESYA